MIMDKQNNKPVQGSQQPAGRSNESAEGKPGKQDISQVDQQEGEMDNGELGGNLREETEGSHKNSK